MSVRVSSRHHRDACTNSWACRVLPLSSPSCRHRLCSYQDVPHTRAVPALSTPWLQPLGVQCLRNRVHCRSCQSEGQNAINGSPLAFALAIRLPAFTRAILSAHPLPRSCQLGHDHALFIFRDTTHDLPHQLTGWIIAAQVWFHCRYQSHTTTLQVTEYRFLNHQVTCKPI